MEKNINILRVSTLCKWVEIHCWEVNGFKKKENASQNRIKKWFQVPLLQSSASAYRNVNDMVLFFPGPTESIQITIYALLAMVRNLALSPHL